MVFNKVVLKFTNNIISLERSLFALQSISITLFPHRKRCGKKICLILTILTNFQHSGLLSWTSEDSDLLLAQVAASGKEKVEEVDFEGIFEENFQGKCVDWQHLQKQLKNIMQYSRRDYNIPCYKKEGLQSAVKAERERRQVGKVL